MGSLSQANTGRIHTLAARTLIGRSRRCDLCIPHPSISGEHAIIWWTGDRWQIRDLGSRNGTRVDAVAVAEAPTDLELDSRIELGAHPLPWTVTSLAPPRARAVARVSNRSVEAVDGILALPDDEAAELVIYGNPRTGWTLERGDHARPVEDREQVEVGGTSYVLELPQLLAETTDLSSAAPRLAELGLRFHVSSDEEHVQLVALIGEPPSQRALDLGARSHHYALLTLARARLADAELSSGDRGWVYRDQLQDQLQIDRQQLNMLVFRARKQLAGSGVEDARDLVERRDDTQQLRLGVQRLEILDA
ncbi:FHA domain-containing protein [Enhygromyxa salina]|uniref:FHA domain protein n=1 Tax=Enhygromyxa salina TaxID=215803 RepID=A0A2S9YML4_9BACT|nr:FHA domain-containing protein [Enhygromyxa salina]PRQ06332.1 FHA domain protein [Enhygromyxa salina]